MQKKVKVCIVTPGHLTSNPRVVKEAEAFARSGFEVSIICGDYIPGSKEKDLILADRCWEVKHVRFGSKVAPFTTHLRQKLCQIFAHGMAKALGVSPALSSVALSPAALDLANAAASVRADLYVAHYVAALPAAAHAAKRYGGRYAFDAEDFHLGDLPDVPSYSFVRSLIRSVEERWLSESSYVTAASPLIADAYKEAYDIPLPIVILNAVPSANGAPGPTKKGNASKSPSLYWFSQTIGPGRGIEIAIEAIAISSTSPHFFLRGVPVVGYRDKLENLAARLGVSDRLHFLEMLTPEELEREGSVYDIGYSGEEGHWPNNQKALGNKIFSYMSSGIAIIASKTAAHVRFYPLTEGAMSVFEIGDKEGLARCIDELLTDPEVLANARIRSWEIGRSHFSWEIEATKLINLVRSKLL